MNSVPGGMAALARYVADAAYGDLPDEVVERAKMCLLDNLGCALLGSTGEGSQLVRQSLPVLGAGDEATIVLSGARASAFGAALVHGTYINVTELAEGVSKAVVHPGTVIVPAVLAEGERLGRSGGDVLLALVAAYEVLIRLGWSLGHDPARPLDTVQAQSLHRGWYPPSLLGAFGAAAAAGKLSGLDEARLAESFGICGNLSPTTLLAAFRQGPMVKSLGAGWCSALGIYAARLAGAGLTGVREVERHLFPLLVDAVDFDRLTDGLGRRYDILTLDVKFFAAGPVLAELECAFQLLERHSLDPAQIEEVAVFTNRRTALLADPVPATPIAAKFSAPYCLAQALLGRTRQELMVDAFSEEAVQSPEWRPLAARVRLQVDDEFDRAFESYPPRRRPSRLAIRLADGSVVGHQVDGAPGLPIRPPTRVEYVAKFSYLAGRHLPERQVRTIVDLVTGFEEVQDVGELARALVAA